MDRFRFLLVVQKRQTDKGPSLKQVQGMEKGNTRLVGEGGESFREKEGGGWRPLEEKKGLRVTWEGGRVMWQLETSWRMGFH